MVSREEREALRQMAMGMPANRINTITFRLLDALDEAEAELAKARGECTGWKRAAKVDGVPASELEMKVIEAEGEWGKSQVALRVMTERAETAEAELAGRRRVDDVYIAMAEADSVALAAMTELAKERRERAEKAEASASASAVEVIRGAAHARLAANALAAMTERAEKAEADAAAIVGMDSPWPLRDVLVNLAKAVDHLLQDHACDAHGYESVVAARAEVARYVGMIDLARAGAGATLLAELEAARAVVEAARAHIAWLLPAGSGGLAGTPGAMASALATYDARGRT